MPSNKTPVIDGLNKEFWKVFWNELKDILLKLFIMQKLKKDFSTSQKQVVIELLERKARAKRLI